MITSINQISQCDLIISFHKLLNLEWMELIALWLWSCVISLAKMSRKIIDGNRKKPGQGFHWFNISLWSMHVELSMAQSLSVILHEKKMVSGLAWIYKYLSFMNLVNCLDSMGCQHWHPGGKRIKAIRNVVLWYHSRWNLVKIQS